MESSEDRIHPPSDGSQPNGKHRAHRMPQMEEARRRLANPELYEDEEPIKLTVHRPSTRVKKDDIKKPWLNRPRSPKEKLANALPVIGAFLGSIVAGILVWDGWNSVVNHNYVLLYEDDFSNGLNKSIWEPEIQVGGFG